MHKIKIAVTQVIEVSLEEKHFDDRFMKGFRDKFFYIDDLEGHAMHLAQLYARGIVDNREFIEGYGPCVDMGIEFNEVEQYEEVVD
jgi:hypothetical protein